MCFDGESPTNRKISGNTLTGRRAPRVCVLQIIKFHHAFQHGSERYRITARVDGARSISECVKECFIHVLVFLLLIFTVCRFCVLWTGESVKWFWKSIVLLIREGPVECFITVGAITGGATLALAVLLAFLSNWYEIAEAREASIGLFFMCGGVFTVGVILIAVLQIIRELCGVFFRRLRTESWS